jgi:hypothetical protein
VSTPALLCSSNSHAACHQAAAKAQSSTSSIKALHMQQAAAAYSCHAPPQRCHRHACACTPTTRRSQTMHVNCLRGTELADGLPKQPFTSKHKHKHPHIHISGIRHLTDGACWLQLDCSRKSPSQLATTTLSRSWKALGKQPSCRSHLAVAYVTAVCTNNGVTAIAHAPPAELPCCSSLVHQRVGTTCIQVGSRCIATERIIPHCRYNLKFENPSR